MPNNILQGTDGVVPLLSTPGFWRMWGLPNVYVGTVGQNKWVPNVADYILDPDTFTVYKVTAVDPTTLIPTYIQINLANSNYSLSLADVLFGVGPGTPADTYRVYLDTSVIPHTLAVDMRMKVAGSSASYARIFRGSDLSGTGQVISQVFDNSGNFLTDHVPLELVGIDNTTNYSIKTVAVCNCNIAMQDAEIVTIVIYSSNGTVLSKRQCLVENTSFIRSLNSSQKYVTGVSLITPFLSTTDANTIRMPINLPLNSLNLQGLVSYSDGSSVILPVDGSKFRVFGLDQFVASMVGQNFPIVLNYILGSNEVGYGVTSNGTLSSDGKTFNTTYNLITTTVNAAYNVKLFGYPVWSGNPGTGYTMRWFLFNLDRNVYFDVTSQVNYSTNTGPFNPTLYGVIQSKDMTINLANVSGTFQPYTYSQMVNIVLQEAPNGMTTPWLMSNDNIPSHTAYGANLLATTSSLTNNVINVSCGKTTLTDWLNAVYYSTYPLVNPVTETVPPVPTHFEIIQGNLSTEFTIDQYINPSLSVAAQPHQYDTVFIKFIKRNSTGDLQLSVAAMLVGSLT